MIKKKLSNAVILGSADLNNGVNSVENNKLNQTQDRIELDYKLDYNQITNCILSAPNGVATYSGSTITVKQDLKVLIPNGRNADGTLKNIEYTVASDISETISSSLMVDCYVVCEPDNATYTTWESNRVFVQEEEPTNLAQLLQIGAIAWYKPSTNQWQKLLKNSVQPYDWQSFKFITLGKFNFNQGAFTYFDVYQPVELLKRSDKDEIISWGVADYSKAATITFTQGQTYTIPYDCEIAFAQGPNESGGAVSFKLNDDNGPIIYFIGSSTIDAVSSDRIRLLKGTKIYIWRYNLGGGWIYNFIAPLIGAEQ